MKPVWSVSCPKCKAREDEPCHYPNGNDRASHADRVYAYLEKQDAHEKEADKIGSETVNTE